MMGRNLYRFFGRWQWWLRVCLLALMPWVGAHASVQEIRVVGVGIDTSSRKAEELALDYAKKRAVYLAAARLGIENPGKACAKLKPEQLDDILRGATITNRRRTEETTYLDVQVTVVEEVLRRALGLPPAEAVAGHSSAVARGVLLLSVYLAPERGYLWEKENLIRPLIINQVRREAAGGVLLPGGDLEDLRLVDYQNAVSVKPEELTPMFDRYGADEIIIALVKPGATGSEEATHIVLRRLGRTAVKEEMLEVAPTTPDETAKSRLDRAAATVAAAVAQIANSTSEREQALRAKAETVALIFDYSIPRDLARMQKAASDAPETLAIEMPSIALSQVKGTVYLKGKKEDFAASLRKQGVLVTPRAEGWHLSVR